MVDRSPDISVVVFGAFDDVSIVDHSESAIGVDSSGVIELGSLVGIEGSDENRSVEPTGSNTGMVDPVSSVSIEIREAKVHSPELTVTREG